MKPVATKVGLARFGTATLLSALAWLAGSRAAEAGVNVWTPLGVSTVSLVVSDGELEPEDATRAGAPPIDANSGSDDRSIFLRAERS